MVLHIDVDRLGKQTIETARQLMTTAKTYLSNFWSKLLTATFFTALSSKAVANLIAKKIVSLESIKSTNNGFSIDGRTIPFADVQYLNINYHEESDAYDGLASAESKQQNREVGGSVYMDGFSATDPSGQSGFSLKFTFNKDAIGKIKEIENKVKNAGGNVNTSNSDDRLFRSTSF